ncbi:MAG: glycosyltransferase family 4 protein [Nitrospinota bacterium]
MKILVVSPFFPYKNVPHAGGHYILELLKGLAKKHEVHFLSRIEPEERKYLSEVLPLCRALSLYPFETPKKRNALGVLRILHSYLRLGIKANRFLDENRFDIVLVEYVETALMMGKSQNCQMVMDAHDIISKPAERRYRGAKKLSKKVLLYLFWNGVKGIETFITSRFHLVFTRSDIDKRYLLQMRPGARVVTVAHPIKKLYGPRKPEAGKFRILFAGAMHRAVNQDAVRFVYEKVLPEVRRQVPEAEFCVVGNKPPRFIKEYAEKDKAVKVTGFVPDIMAYYEKASVFVAPLFIGGGIIAKNLDAMGAGVPVVTSTIGNEGIGAVQGESVLIAESPEEFSRCIVQLLQDSEFARKISEGGRMFVKTRFAPDVIERLVEDNLSALVAGNR